MKIEDNELIAKMPEEIVKDNKGIQAIEKLERTVWRRRSMSGTGWRVPGAGNGRSATTLTGT